MGCEWVLDQQRHTGDYCAGDAIASICVIGCHHFVLVCGNIILAQDVKLWRIHSSSAAAVAEEFCSVQPVCGRCAVICMHFSRTPFKLHSSNRTFMHLIHKTIIAISFTQIIVPGSYRTRHHTPADVDSAQCIARLV